MQSQVSVKPLPYFYIGKDITTLRINNYQAQKHNLLSQAIGKPDTKCIWYSKEHITKLLEEIEHAGGDGMRIHLGMYEDAHEFAGQLCLVMTSTREKLVGETIVHANVILENEPDYAERSAAPKDISFLKGGNPLMSKRKDFNYGSPCPPRCDGSDETPYP